MVGKMKERDRSNRTLVDFFGKSSIKKQMYTVYFVAIVLPVLLLGVFLVVNTSRLLTNYHSDLLNSDNVRVKSILFEITTQVYNLAENIAFHEPLQPVLTGHYENMADFRKAVNQLTVLDTYKNTYMEISDITIYCDNPDIWDYKQYQRVTKEVEEQPWYKMALQQSKVFWTVLPREDIYGNCYWNLCLVRRITLVDSDYHGVLLIRISDDYLRAGIENGSHETFLSVDREPVFYSTDRRKYGQRQPVEIDSQQSYYQFSGRIHYEDETCFARVSTLNAYQSDSRFYITSLNYDSYVQICNILTVCFIILGLAIILPGILIFFFTNYFTGRVSLLRQEMHKASRQDYELIPAFRGNDELSEAFSDLQLMVGNIKEQEAKVYEARLKEQQLENEQREMEYKNLASQINPHFLYNTLETIRMKAFTAGDREVAGAIKLLGKSMRYVLENTGAVKTTLQRELEHVQTYLEIQKLRFGERFDCSTVIEEVDTGTITLLPLLLQPLVENSVVHAMEDMVSDGHIQIKVYHGISPTETKLEEALGKEVFRLENPKGEDRLYIEVWDNGKGMSREELLRLRENIDQKDISRSKSIGLYNINQRIRMQYGEEYPLSIDSAEGLGTRVRLTLPMDGCRLV